MRAVSRRMCTAALGALLLLPGSAPAQQPPGADEPAPDATLARFLAACAGDCADLEAFVRDRYHPKVLADPDLVQQFVRSFARLKLEFGPLEPRGQSPDAEYGAVKHHLFGTASEEWATLMFIEDPASGKLRGHGLWKLEAPAGWSPPRLPPEELGVALRAHLERLGLAGLFRGTVLLVRGDETLLDVALGPADGERPLATDERLPIASITKMVTAAAVLQLAEDGRLGLDDPLARWVPEYPQDIATQVTLRQLLTHVSGLELDDSPRFNEQRRQARSLDEVLAAQLACLDELNEGRRQDFRPLGRFDYSNDEYDLLGLVVQRAGGLSFEEFVAQRIGQPAGLTATSFAPSAGLRGASWRSDEGEDQPCRGVEVELLGAACPGPAGGLVSTTADLRRFVAWLRAPREGGPLLERMQAGAVPEAVGRRYGLGLRMQDSAGGPALGHNGGMRGMSSELRYWPERDVLLVVLCNREHAAPALFTWLADRL